MNYITATENPDAKLINIKLQLQCNDDIYHSLKTTLMNDLADPLWDAIEKFYYDENNAPQVVKVKLSTSDVEVVKCLIEEMDRIISNFVHQCENGGHVSEDEKMAEFERLIASG